MAQDWFGQWESHAIYRSSLTSSLGSFPDMLWLRATTLYPSSCRKFRVLGRPVSVAVQGTLRS